MQQNYISLSFEAFHKKYSFLSKSNFLPKIERKLSAFFLITITVITSLQLETYFIFNDIKKFLLWKIT